MTHEKRAVVIKRCLLLVWSVVIVGGAWFFPWPRVEVAKGAADEPRILAVVHYNLPGDPSSAQMGAILDRIHKKYGKQITVSHLDSPPPAAKEGAVQAARKAPCVTMSLKAQEYFYFGGPLPYADVEQKVEEILRGLERVGPGWRPEVTAMKASEVPPGDSTGVKGLAPAKGTGVKGMTPAGK